MHLNEDITMTIEIVLHDKHGEDFSARRRVRHEVEVVIDQAWMSTHEHNFGEVTTEATRLRIREGALAAAKAVSDAYFEILNQRATRCAATLRDETVEATA